MSTEEENMLILLIDTIAAIGTSPTKVIHFLTNLDEKIKEYERKRKPFVSLTKLKEIQKSYSQTLLKKLASKIEQHIDHKDDQSKRIALELEARKIESQTIELNRKRQLIQEEVDALEQASKKQKI